MHFRQQGPFTCYEIGRIVLLFSSLAYIFMENWSEKKKTKVEWATSMFGGKHRKPYKNKCCEMKSPLKRDKKVAEEFKEDNEMGSIWLQIRLQSRSISGLRSFYGFDL